MSSQPRDKIVKRGTFLYEGPVRVRVDIVQTDFRPGAGDYEAPEDDAHGEFYEVRYSQPNSSKPLAGGGYHGSLADAVRAVGASVRDVRWED